MMSEFLKVPIDLYKGKISKVLSFVMLLLKYILSLSLLIIRFCGATELEEFLEARDEDGIIEITDANYEKFSSGLDGYYNVLFITMRSLDDAGDPKCGICVQFENTFREVARLAQNQHPDLKALYMISDVHNTRQLIRDLMLQNVPHTVVYAPKQAGKSFSWKDSQFYQYQMLDSEIENPLHFGDFLGKTLDIALEIKEDFNVQEFLTYFVVCTALFVFFKRIVLPRIPNKGLFFSMILAFGILLPSITGYKFTQINGIPFIAKDGEGRIMYFSGGMGWQFGIEIASVSFMYVAMGVCVLLLIYWDKFVKDNDNARVLGSLFICSLLFFFFSYFINCFNIKHPGYPFGY